MSARVLKVPVDGPIEVVDLDSLEDFRVLATAIGSEYIDTITFRDHRLVFVLDEEGLMRGQETNWRLTGLALFLGWPARTPLVGDALVVGLDHEDLTGLPSYVEQIIEAIGVRA